MGRAGLLVVVVLVILGAVGLAQTAPGRSVLDSVGLTGDPPRYTELSFTSPRALPFGFVRGGLLHLDFDIHNLEGKPRLYTWRIELSAGRRRPRVAARGVVLTRSAENVHVAAGVRIPCRGAREVIAVRLADPPLALRFGAKCLGPARPARGRRG